MKIFVNTRRQSQSVTGLQRYTSALLSRSTHNLKTVAPRHLMGSVHGQLWEQFVLPGLLNHKLLFSPANTGPLSIRHQVVTIHDVFPLDYPKLLPRGYGHWYRFLTPRLVQSVKQIITLSHFSKERLVATCSASSSKISVIANGVDTRFRPMSIDEIEEGIEAVELPSRNYLFCMGSPEPRKNITRLIKAWCAVQDDVQRDIWLVIGGVESTADLGGSLAGEVASERVFFAGRIPDDALPALYAGALGFVFPTVYEGFGLPVLESMASGTPVLAGNRTAVPEVVGEAGLTVDPYSIDELAWGLKTLVNDSELRDRLRGLGLARAGYFSWDETARRTEAILEHVASEMHFDLQ